MGLGRACPLAVLVAVTLSACTVDSVPLETEAPPQEETAPPPASGLSVAVVLPPGDPTVDLQVAELRDDLSSLSRTPPDGVDDLRVVTTDAPRFVTDVARLLARDGTDLICVFGDAARRTVRDVSELYPELDYCALPAVAVEGGRDDRLTLVDVRMEEIGHLAGVAALAAAGEGPVGAVIAGDRVGRGEMVAGLEATVGAERLGVHTVASLEEALEAVAELVEEDEVTAIVLDVDHDEVLYAASERVRVVAPTRMLPAGESPDAVVATWSVHWAAIVRPVIEHMVDEEVEIAASVGLSDEVLHLTPAGDASVLLRRQVALAVEGLLQRETDPLEPD